jgi:hypothetical protein
LTFQFEGPSSRARKSLHHNKRGISRYTQETMCGAWHGLTISSLPKRGLEGLPFELPRQVRNEDFPIAVCEGRDTGDTNAFDQSVHNHSTHPLAVACHRRPSWRSWSRTTQVNEAAEALNVRPVNQAGRRDSTCFWRLQRRVHERRGRKTKLGKKAKKQNTWNR